MTETENPDDEWFVTNWEISKTVAEWHEAWKKCTIKANLHKNSDLNIISNDFWSVRILVKHIFASTCPELVTDTTHVLYG